ncbi:hypothetical protein FOTG_12318 [Fusarium oxysporum f. sp. vasinfectum 25433]|uniref:Uncharacterized protein n=1 Tax=Fusarium oxysporum f. sp. vasinfectum 25433 TaxID=1089449 RepID=X0L1E5_FUSOX|nr:hypothetical protein FOTG_12318 [Fusarium oxysporum f. sp. vasinfectum 25433]
MAVNGKSRQDWMDKCAYSNTDSVGRLGCAGEQGIMTPSQR